MSAADPNPAPPRLPVLGWAAFRGARDPASPSILDSRHLVYTTSGRAAIALALRFLGVGRGDRVLVPSYNCPTMVAPVLRLGATPAFFPLTAQGGPDLGRLEHVGLDGVRAILVAHYFGLPQPFAAVRAFCDAHGIALIEDCAHMFFGTVDGSPVGSWGDLAIASLTKFYPVAEGGCLISNSRDLAEIKLAPRSVTEELKAFLDVIEIGARHRRFRGLNALLRGVFWLKDAVKGRHGASLTPLEQPSVAPSVDDYTDTLLWSRLTRASRRIVRSARHSRIIELRRRNFELLAGLLADLPGAAPFATALPPGTAPYVFPLRVTNPEPRYLALRQAGVPVFRWDRIWPGTPRIPGDHGLAWATEMFQLGCHQDLTAEDIRGIASTVRKVFQRFA